MCTQPNARLQKSAGFMGQATREHALESEAAELQSKFEEAFWCDDLSTYALALDGNKKPCRVRASNAWSLSFYRDRQPGQSSTRHSHSDES